MINFVPFIVFAVLWYAVAKQFKSKGRGAFIRHLTGFVVGVLGLLISVVIIAPKPETATTEAKTEATTPVEIPKEEPKAEEEQKAAQTPAVVDAQKAEEQVEKVTKEPAVEEKVNQTLDINANQLAQRINSALSEIGSPYKMPKKLKVEKGAVNDTTSYQFSKEFAVVMTIDKKTQKVMSMITILTPKSEGGDENMVMLFSDAAVLSAFEGKGQIKTVGKRIMDALMKTMTAYGETKQDQKDDFIFNGKKYSVSVSSYTGVMMTAGFSD
ncbi:hypothetical protein [Haemophilus haemolyticus]|uniref:hypothetical protein n=1 Tax=Haemophilus haemolyticus TaxID=726 RepID=UPI0015C67BA4|nr:hypothetical protein [Haemophilus haemolyticus]NYA48025.1 hypothetical protein [Haemophilus haemolyticus]